VYIGVAKAVLDVALHELPISLPHTYIHLCSFFFFISIFINCPSLCLTHIHIYIGVANAIFDHLSMKLPISRLQRDLTDSTGTIICVCCVLLYVCPHATGTTISVSAC
jgi:hypothetical protein